MSLYRWVISTYTRVAQTDMELGPNQFRKYVRGYGKILVMEHAGLVALLNKADFFKALKKLPPEHRFKCRLDTYVKSEKTYTVLNILGVINNFDPNNWRGNLQFATHKQVIDLLHMHGQEVLQEIAA